MTFRQMIQQMVEKEFEQNAADVYEVVKEWCYKRNCIIVAREDFSRIEVQYERWIPVTERLPEKDGDYLVTYTDGGVTGVGSSIYLQREDGSEPYWDYFVVTAWMPLPEPYKGGERE